MARLALVTGGTRGIGAAISQALKNAGYNVVANDVAEGPAKEFTEKTGIPHALFDVSDFNATKEGIAKIVAEHGPIEIVVNNAGITRDAPLHKMTAENWNLVINVNLNSMFNTVRNVIESMRERGFGRIINISSINGIVGQFGQTNYSAAKAGALGFTKAVAHEGAAKGITSNAICPGYIGTEMVAKIAPEILKTIVAKIPTGRLGDPSEIARTVVFLAAEDAGFINGATFSINGGQVMY
ncbi:Acetoacetyl-CoA reductase [uncultured Gammaproteobacteria bacterium]